MPPRPHTETSHDVVRTTTCGRTLGHPQPQTEDSNKARPFLGEINFSPKLVKVTKEDMIEKPKRTRNWKGRRAAERLKMAMEERERVSEEPPGSNRSHRTTAFHSCSDIPPEERLQTAPGEETILEENFSDFLTSLEDVPDIEEYFRWALPNPGKPQLDLCSTQGTKPNLKFLAKHTDRFWDTCVEIFNSKLIELEELQQQEDETVQKIEKYLKRMKAKMRKS